MTLERHSGDHGSKKDLEIKKDTLPVYPTIEEVWDEMADQGRNRRKELVLPPQQEDTGITAPGFLRKAETLIRELPYDAKALGTAAIREAVTAYDARGTAQTNEKKKPIKKAQRSETTSTVFSKYDGTLGIGKLTNNPSHPRGKVEAGLSADGIGALLLTSDNFKVQAAGAILGAAGLAMAASGIKEGVSSDDKSRPAKTPEEVKEKRLDSFQDRIDRINRRIDMAEDKGKYGKVKRLKDQRRSLTRRQKKLKQH